jgi:SM-20-related protein
MNPLLLNKLELIADGLAEQGYAIVDNFLSPEEVHAILQQDEFKNGLLQFKKASIGKQHDKQINEAIRGDYIQWIDRSNSSVAIQAYLSKLNELISHVNQSLFLSVKDYEVHKTIYPAGSYYKRHLDQFKQDDHRRLSVICYLNENWQPQEGGELRIYLQEKTQDVLPCAGRLVCFRSDLLEHEVLPATRPRSSITGWILDQFAELRHL